MISKKISLQKNDFNNDGSIKFSSLLTYMQNGALEDAEKYEATHENLAKDNMFFAVYRNTLKIVKDPSPFINELVLVTFQSSHDRMKFTRSYFIYEVGKEPDITKDFNPYENAIIFCNSVWVLMDLNKRCLLRATELKYPVEEYPIQVDRIPKILKNDDNLKLKGEFVGNKYFIDENGHVNNAHYANIVFDYASKKIKIENFDIIYEHEILPDTQVNVYVEETPTGEKLFGIRKSDNEECFCAEIY